MFTKFLNWIKGVWQKMIGKNTLKQAVGQDIAISEPMITALEKWALMYENKAPWLNNDIVSMNLPAAVAAEISKLVTIELQIKIEGSKRADYLSKQFEKVAEKLRNQIEFGAAKGGLAIKPYVDGKDINVDFVQADQFFPVNFDTNGNITACVFVDQRTEGNKYYTRLEVHNFDSGSYLVQNKAYRSTSRDMLGSQVDLSVVEDWSGLEAEAKITGVDKPLFAYFRVPLANNIDPASPLGVSCYARAVDLIEQADVQWSNLLWEFDSGKRALYVDETALDQDSDGKPVLPHKKLYRTLKMAGQVGGDELFEEWTPDLREKNILNGLDAILKRIEFTCGLAYGTLSDPQNVDKTATEIKTSKQRSYATVVDYQKALKKALNALLYAMDTWCTLNKLAPKGKYEATYEFDDSVIVDKDMQFQQDLRLVGQRLMSDIEFRMRNFGETEEAAKEKLAMIQQATQEEDIFAGA